MWSLCFHFFVSISKEFEFQILSTADWLCNYKNKGVNSCFNINHPITIILLLPLYILSLIGFVTSQLIGWNLCYLRSWLLAQTSCINSRRFSPKSYKTDSMTFSPAWENGSWHFQNRINSKTMETNYIQITAMLIVRNHMSIKIPINSKNSDQDNKWNP